RVLGQPLLLALVSAEQELDVHRQAGGSRLVRERAHDRLTNPPRRVRREARAALGIELLDGAQETDVAFLDQVRQRKTAIQVAAGGGQGDGGGGAPRGRRGARGPD